MTDEQPWEIALRHLFAAFNDDRDNPCPFTFAHTRHWCGHERCRDT